MFFANLEGWRHAMFMRSRRIDLFASRLVKHVRVVLERKKNGLGGARETTHTHIYLPKSWDFSLFQPKSLHILEFLQTLVKLLHDIVCVINSRSLFANFGELSECRAAWSLCKVPAFLCDSHKFRGWKQRVDNFMRVSGWCVMWTIGPASECREINDPANLCRINLGGPQLLCQN